MSAIFSIIKAEVENESDGNVSAVYSVDINTNYREILEAMVIAQHLNPQINVLFAHAAKIYEGQIMKMVDTEVAGAQDEIKF